MSSVCRKPSWRITSFPTRNWPRWDSSVFAGQKTYNGVALLSREPAQAVQVGIPGFDDEQKRAIAASFGDLRVINLYVVNGKAVGDEKYDYKLRWLQAVHDWIAVERGRYPNLIVRRFQYRAR